MKSKSYCRLKERLVYENKWIELFDDIVQMPNGKEGTYVRMKYHGNPLGVVIVPQLPDGRILFMRINRYAIGELSLELPRGNGEVGEDVLLTAKHELSQETNLTTDQLTILGYCCPDNAILMTKAAVVLASLQEKSFSEIIPEKNEGIEEVLFLSIDEIWKLIGLGKITDAYTLGAISLFHAKSSMNSNTE